MTRPTTKAFPTDDSAQHMECIESLVNNVYIGLEVKFRELTDWTNAVGRTHPIIGSVNLCLTIMGFMKEIVKSTTALCIDNVQHPVGEYHA
jgi:hypothetical protein